MSTDRSVHSSPSAPPALPAAPPAAPPAAHISVGSVIDPSEIEAHLTSPPPHSAAAAATAAVDIHLNANATADGGLGLVVRRKGSMRTWEGGEGGGGGGAGEDKVGLPVKLAFITFNLQSSVKRCTDSCSSGPWSSLLGQKMADRFRYQGSIYDKWSHGGAGGGEGGAEGGVRQSTSSSSSSWQHAPSRFWVERAKPPEDYVYENLAYGAMSHLVRKTVTRLVILGGEPLVTFGLRVREREG